MSQRNQTISKAYWIKLILVPLGMFAFAFALVPLYDTFCDITGLNGRTNSASYDGKPISVDESRTITIDFLASTASGFPVKFYPMTTKMKVVPGKLYTINYYAENRSNEVITGQAVPSVAPGEAASHLKKLECFCFNKQTFQPKQPIEMPVRFFVDSDIGKKIYNITLSYNFIKVKNAASEGVAGL